MYGIVNIALEQLIIEENGNEFWEMIKNKAGYEDLVFSYMESYEDDITEKLVSVASMELGITEEELLERFGTYWVIKTAQKSYAHFFKMGGKNVREFVSNLDHIHRRLSVSFQDIKAPQFDLIRETETSMTITYTSERQAYLPLTIGLIKGLFQHFNEQGTVRATGKKIKNGIESDLIELTFS